MEAERQEDYQGVRQMPKPSPSWHQANPLAREELGVGGHLDNEELILQWLPRVTGH